MAQMNKKELINILVEEYGYEKEDLKFDAEGKPYTNAKLKALIDAEEADAKELEMNANRVTVRESKLKDSDRVYVMNGLTGGLFYHSERSNKRWEFRTFGQMDTMEYGELKILLNTNPRMIKQAMLIVLDKDVQDEFNLTELYKNIITPENIEDVFKMDVEDLDKFIDALPDAQKNTLLNTAQMKYESRELYDRRIIDLIEKKFNLSLETNAPLDDIVGTRETHGSQKIIIVNK